MRREREKESAQRAKERRNYHTTNIIKIYHYYKYTQVPVVTRREQRRRAPIGLSLGLSSTQLFFSAENFVRARTATQIVIWHFSFIFVSQSSFTKKHKSRFKKLSLHTNHILPSISNHLRSFEVNCVIVYLLKQQQHTSNKSLF